jgi:hypothetical protein
MAATATAAAPVAVGAELEKALEGLESGLVRLCYFSRLSLVLAAVLIMSNVATLPSMPRAAAAGGGAASLALPVISRT